MIIERVTEHAEGVLDIVAEWLDRIKDNEGTDDVTAIIRSYVNGRENGFSVVIERFHTWPRTVETRVVWFSEYRRSDEVVVYPEAIQGCTFDPSSLSENAWKDLCLFDTPREAAEFCIDFLGAFNEPLTEA